MRRREFITLLGGTAARGRWQRVRNSQRCLSLVCYPRVHPISGAPGY